MLARERRLARDASRRPKIPLRSCGRPPRRTRSDRKSTRLNSSHVATSYAVFCLKKKNDSGALIVALNKSATDMRSALENTSDKHLMKSWRLLARGKVVMEAPRYEMIQDTIHNWA